MTSVYIDTSALVKLVVVEPEGTALRASLAGWTYMVSSEMTVVELLRAVRRHPLRSEATSEQEALEVLETLALQPVDRDILHRASQLDPPLLRSLDAIHLASALDIADELDYFVTYDIRLVQAAGAAGFVVLSPS